MDKYLLLPEVNNLTIKDNYKFYENKFKKNRLRI